MKIYPADFEKKIGFDQVRTILADLAMSERGKREVDNIAFSSDFQHIKKQLNEVENLCRALDAGLDIPSVPFEDAVAFLNLILTQGNYVSADKLLIIQKSLLALSDIDNFISQLKKRSDADTFSFLIEKFNNLELFRHIVSEISVKINKFGEVKDTASPRLSEIRSSMRSLSGAMTATMKRVIAKYSSAGFLNSDASPSIRDGRLCIPVAPMNKRKINGIVHDVSSTGQTFYIEPAEVVEVSNQIRELEAEEQREIVRILIELADSLRPDVPDIINSLFFLDQFDLLLAKAKFAFMIEAQLPSLDNNPIIEWYHAVHPIMFLNFKKTGNVVVPQNITLGDKNKILIISGPNAGGKSVCLKTVGLIQYMAQSGLLPPVYSNSHLGVFKNIFIDIGDEQSIENDLSSYSSHLINMKYFIRNSDETTLFLADEIGSKTEPQIGGSLAQAILIHLNKKNAIGLVTTHFQNLKTLADTLPGFVNGAMLYDRQHLKPLFQLSIGVAGSSFALDIAQKIGIPSGILDEAKEIVGSNYLDIDKYLADIARDRRYWANKRLNIKEKEHKLNQTISQYEQDALMLHNQRSEILKKAKNEASDIISSANARIENAIHQIKKADAEKIKTKKIREELSRYNLQLKEEDKDLPEILRKSKKILNKKKTPELPSSEKTPISVGDHVKITDGSSNTGVVLLINGKNAEVAFGNLRTKISVDKLSHAKPPKSTVKNTTVITSSDDQSRSRQLNFKQEIDIRGMRADEALQAVTYFIDDAIQFSEKRVRILHGTGHGILRTFIRKQLAATNGVESFHDEDVRLGGAGITVVNLL